MRPVQADAIIVDIQGSLQQEADPRRAEREQRYFKGTIRSHGLTVPRSRAIARDVYRRHRGALTVDGWLYLSERLLATAWFEQWTVGLYLVQLVRPSPSEALFDTYERWLGAHVGNWAHCDDLSASLIGPVLVGLPHLVGRLRSWTASENRWVRRGAAVSLVIPARRGLFLETVLAIAQSVLEDDDDLVRKGYGWMLREAAKAHRAEVTAFLEREVRRVPRIAFRYAIEKFPAVERKRLMAL
jgi:3-methyladenine DNA glycosylase AlkD